MRYKGAEVACEVSTNQRAAEEELSGAETLTSVWAFSLDHWLILLILLIRRAYVKPLLGSNAGSTVEPAPLFWFCSHLIHILSNFSNLFI